MKIAYLPIAALCCLPNKKFYNSINFLIVRINNNSNNIASTTTITKISNTTDTFHGAYEFLVILFSVYNHTSANLYVLDAVTKKKRNSQSIARGHTQTHTQRHIHKTQHSKLLHFIKTKLKSFLSCCNIVCLLFFSWLFFDALVRKL